MSDLAEGYLAQVNNLTLVPINRKIVYRTYFLFDSLYESIMQIYVNPGYHDALLPFLDLPPLLLEMLAKLFLRDGTGVPSLLTSRK